MGTYISFPRTCDIKLRLSVLLIALLLHLTLTKASLLPIVVSGQTEVSWDRTIRSSKQASGLGGLGGEAAAIGTSKLLVWLGGAGSSSSSSSSSSSGQPQQQLRRQQQQQLLQQHGSSSMSGLVPAGGGQGSMHVQHRPRHPYSGGIGATRVYHVHNRCSGGFVRLLDDGVDAEGGPNDDSARLVFETARNNLVLIRHNNHYLCFNQKGKLVTETEPTELCLFNDTLTESHHTELLLATASRAAVTNPVGGTGDWLVGFTKNGKPWRGYEYRRGRPKRCFQFTKSQIVGTAYSASHRRDTYALPGREVPAAAVGSSDHDPLRLRLPSDGPALAVGGIDDTATAMVASDT